jgi:Holliday junction DNA helicase RuvA
MIDFLNGNIAQKNPAYCVIECNGIGYLVQISLNTFSKLPNSGNCKVNIYYSVSVDVRSGKSDHNLFGFAEKSERELFKHLISVSGVSANTARMILSSLSPEEVHAAILTENVSLIKSVKGIGPKLAQKITVELKDKLSKDENLDLISPIAHNTTREEALSALLALGFDKLKSGKLLDKILVSNTDLSVEQLIKKALKQL